MKKRAVSLAAVSVLSCLAVVRSPSEAAHSFRVTNNGSHSIARVYISGVDRNGWGKDLLGDNQYIDPGEYMSFDITEGCDEDILVVYENGEKDEADDWNTCSANIQYTY